jgi:hypothetical protein
MTPSLVVGFFFCVLAVLSILMMHGSLRNLPSRRILGTGALMMQRFVAALALRGESSRRTVKPRGCRAASALP